MARRWIAALRAGVADLLGFVPQHRRLSGPIQFLLWLVTAFEWIVALLLFDTALQDDGSNYGLLSAKLTLLGLVGAIGIFQYQTWQQAVRSYMEAMSRPEWSQLERILANPKGIPPEYQQLLETTHKRLREFVLEFLRSALPHNEATIWNAISAAVLLTVSSLCDLGRLLLPTSAAPMVRLVSTATFLTSFGPFLDSAWRYALAAKRDFDATEELLKLQAADVEKLKGPGGNDS